MATGKELVKLAQSVFKTAHVTPEQLDYVITMMKPSSYVLKHHTVRGHGVTFNISNYDYNKAVGHRPWQVAILNDQAPDKVIIKSRQLGLILSSIIG